MQKCFCLPSWLPRALDIGFRIGFVAAFLLIHARRCRGIEVQVQDWPGNGIIASPPFGAMPSVGWPRAVLRILPSFLFLLLPLSLLHFEQQPKNLDISQRTKLTQILRLRSHRCTCLPTVHWYRCMDMVVCASVSC